jgi:predicted nuclease with TOPRIM domain
LFTGSKAALLGRSRSGLQRREEYPEVGFLEELVKKKDQLVERLDVNDELVEATVDQMTEKKKHIREEQNHLAERARRPRTQNEGLRPPDRK